MSFWSVSVMGGPQALTALARLEDALGLTRGQLYPLDAIPAEAARALAARLDADFKPVQAVLRATPRTEEAAALQALTATLMALGAKLPPAFKHRAAGAIRRDPFSRKMPERQLEMHALKRRLALYTPGTPSAIGEELLTTATGRRRIARIPQPVDADAARAA